MELKDFAGYCIGDWDCYVIEGDENILDRLISEAWYSSRDEAYDDEFYYYSEWFDMEDEIKEFNILSK